VDDTRVHRQRELPGISVFGGSGYEEATMSAKTHSRP
jgi:hypothetical protein